MKPTQFAGYSVDEYGNVFSHKRNKWLDGNINHDGYRRYNLHVDNLSKKVFAHVLVAEAFIGPKPNRCEVNHKDGNKLNNHCSNLEYVTGKENVKHAYANGLRENIKPVTVVNIETGEELSFTSRTECCQHFGYTGNWTVRAIEKGRQKLLRRVWKVKEGV